ncbi:MAG: AraC family transcriptional regulator [Myxococcales bacterium]|jgi:AraC family transcriptional regulator of adaptative response/methylated-DNA-[protein]-cysteine methyltransferase|nr:AraC family transcriptional regulator [Myxococcales bacterium]
MSHPESEAAAEYARIERAIQFLTERRAQQPSLDEVAAHVGQSPFHFQRLFHRWAGVSPKRFVQFLTLEHAKQRLRASATVLDAAYDAGLSGPSRLHDLFVSLEAVTPGEYRSAGAGLQLRWGIGDSPFGRCFIAVTARGICALSFLCEQAEDGSSTSESEAPRALLRDWPRAEIQRDDDVAADWLRRVFTVGRAGGDPALSLFVRGTPFQVAVWKALLIVPSGCLTTYQTIARAVGQPRGARAVGNAVGQNPIAWLIPCHRVIRGLGTFGQYRWGSARKTSMLAWEAARAERHDAGDRDRDRDRDGSAVAAE